MTNSGELGYLLAQRNPNQLSRSGAAGASELGLALGGAFGDDSQHYKDVFDDRAARVGRMEEQLARARATIQSNITRENQRAARKSLSDRYRSQGNSDLADMFAGYDNPEQIAAAEKTLQAADYTRQAWAARNGNLEDLNRALMVIHGQPVQTTRNEGGVLLNPYGSPEQQTVTTEIGKALAGEHNAAAARSYAGANLDKARTDQVKSGGAGKPQALTSEMTRAFFSKPVLDQDGKQATDSQGRPVTQIDTGKLANFMQFADRPGVSANQNAAIPAYTNTYGAQNDNPPPGAIDLGAALTGAPAQAAASQPTAKIATPQSQADFDALPSGATYVNPADGKTYRKKNVVRTGTSADGKRVVQYDDGTIGYAAQ